MAKRLMNSPDIGAPASVEAPPCETTQARAMRSCHSSEMAWSKITTLPCGSHMTLGVERWP